MSIETLEAQTKYFRDGRGLGMSRIPINELIRQHVLDTCEYMAGTIFEATRDYGELIRLCCIAADECGFVMHSDLHRPVIDSMHDFDREDVREALLASYAGQKPCGITNEDMVREYIYNLIWSEVKSMYNDYTAYMAEQDELDAINAA